jgi:hypothetical protein
MKRRIGKKGGLTGWRSRICTHRVVGIQVKVERMIVSLQFVLATKSTESIDAP